MSTLRVSVNVLRTMGKNTVAIFFIKVDFIVMVT